MFIILFGYIHHIFCVMSHFNSSFAGVVPFHCSAVTLLPTVPDKNIKVTVNGEDSSKPVPLNFGDTVVEILVCSADGSNSQVSMRREKREAADVI